MKRAHALERWELIKAYGEGKNIQGSIDGKTWHDYSSPNWEAEDVQYRIKPYPREFWVVQREGQFLANLNKSSAEFMIKHTNSIPEIIHVREVID